MIENHKIVTAVLPDTGSKALGVLAAAAAVVLGAGYVVRRKSRNKNRNKNEKNTEKKHGIIETTEALKYWH